MKKLFALIALLAAFALPASAENLTELYYGEQVPANQLDQNQKDINVALGQLIWDIIGRSNTGGFFTNLAVTNPSGLYLQVGPAVTNTIGSEYQVLPTLANQFGAGGPFSGSATPLSADPTQIFKQGLIASPLGAMGPVVVPGTAGYSALDLVECQVVEADSSPVTTNFVSSTNVATTGAISWFRPDTINCQIKAGTAATSPTAPTVDTGWIAVGTATVPYGATSITTIAQATPFNGFLPAGSSTSFVDTTTNGQTINATKTWTQTQTYSSGAANIFTGSGSSQLSGASIAADGAANLGLLFNVATGSTGFQFLAGGTATGALVTPAGIFKAGSSLYGPTSATIAGPVTATLLTLGTAGTVGPAIYFGNAIGAGTQTLVGSSTTAVNSVTGTALAVAPQATASPVAAIDAAGDLGLAGTLYAGTGSYGTNASVPGYISSSGLPVGQCVQINSSHQLVGAGGACGLSSGTISAVSSANSLINVNTVSGTVTITATAAPTYTTMTVGSASTAGTINFGTGGVYSMTESGAAFNLPYGASTPAPTFEADGGFKALTAIYGPTQMSVPGNATATEFFGSGAGLTTGTVPLSALATSPVTAVTGSGNISVTAGPTPNATITNSPTFTGTVTAGTFSGSGASLTGIPQSAIVGGVGGTITAGSNIVVTGATSAPTVAVTAAPSFSGYVASSSGFTVGSQSMTTGGLTNSGTLDLVGNTSTGIVLNSLTASSTPAIFQVASSSVSQITSTGGYSVLGSGASSFKAASFGGTASFPTTGTATSGTTDYPSQTLTLSGSYYSGSSASTYTTTLSEDGSGSGFTIAGNNATGGYNTTTLSGERPSLGFVGSGSGSNSISLIAGDTANFGAGTFNIYDSSNSTNLLQISNSGGLTFPGIANYCGTSAGNCTLQAPGTGTLFLNYFSGGGVNIGNGASGTETTFANSGVVTFGGTINANNGVTDSIAYGAGLNDLIRINSGVGTGSTRIGASSGPSVNGVTSSALYIDNGTSSTLDAIDSSGDIGVGGYISASGVINSANTFNDTASAGSVDAYTWDNATSGTSGLYASSTTVASIGSQLMGIAHNGGTTALALDNSGNMGIAGAYYSASERRLKNNIVNFAPDAALSLVNATNVVTYCYKTEQCKPGQIGHVGVIADDTNILIAPHHKAYDIGATAAIDLAAIKALDKQVVELKSEVAVLQGHPTHTPNLMERIHDFFMGS